VATERWQTTFDLIGLAAYLTLMTGEVPDRKLLREARRESGLHLVDLSAEAQVSAKADRSAKAEAPTEVGRAVA